ncbi:autotransporter domain-containing protein [Sphingomonas agri]|uniref:autotransporter domain-containing protein n=1 Tax=Sphingomonas agri TaxID=1813878 RepID=UPI00311F94C8
MNRCRTLRTLATVSLISLAAIGSPVAAQQIQRIVAFGDSYADTGNAFALGYANPQALAVYPTGRFSGGSNYIDTLSQILRVPVQNFAIGGAMGGTNNGTLCFDPTYGAPLCGKGLQYEVDQFLNVGTQSAVFPSASTSFTRSDLLAISIGGNDARVYQLAGGPLATAPAAGTAAGVATGLQLNRLVAQGNPTISFLALNGAVAPEVANNPAAQAIRGAYSTAFYNALQPVLAGYASNGAIVHYLDGTVLAAQVAANPSAYGFTNGLVCPAFPNTTCVVSSNGYLFYGDGLHLTSQGFALVGQYIARQLAAPLTLQAPSDLGLDTAQQWGRTLSSRGDLYGRGSGPEGLRVYAVGDMLQHDIGATSTNSAFEVHSYGASVGAEYGMTGGIIGVAGNYSRPRVKFGNDASRIRGRTWQVGAYGSLGMGGLFGQAYVGYGKDRDRIVRTGVVSDLAATAHGNHWIAGAKGGYLMSFAGVGAGPIVALDYARAKVNGYTETGDAALSLNVGAQSYKALKGQAGLEVRGDLAGLHPFLDVTAEHNFSSDDRLITFAQTDAPTIVNSWQVRGRKETYGRLSGGASASLASSLSVDAFATTTLGRNHGQEVGAQAGVKAAF